jgi:hypothetical protein
MPWQVRQRTNLHSPAAARGPRLPVRISAHHSKTDPGQDPKRLLGGAYITVVARRSRGKSQGRSSPQMEMYEVSKTKGSNKPQPGKGAGRSSAKPPEVAPEAKMPTLKDFVFSAVLQEPDISLDSVMKMMESTPFAGRNRNTNRSPKNKVAVFV